jgi:hypothetical protein
MMLLHFRGMASASWHKLMPTGLATKFTYKVQKIVEHRFTVNTNLDSEV